MKACLASFCFGLSMFLTLLTAVFISGCGCASSSCRGTCPSVGGTGVTCTGAIGTCTTTGITACGCVQVKEGPLDGTRVDKACICQ